MAAAAAAVVPMSDGKDSAAADLTTQYDDLFTRVIKPALIGQAAATHAHLSRVKAEDAAVLQQVRHVMAVVGASTFVELFTATSGVPVTSVATSFRRSWVSFTTQMANLRYYIDSQGNKCDLLGGFSPDQPLDNYPRFHQRAISMRMHYPHLGIYDEAKQMADASRRTEAENAEHAYQSGIAYALLVRSHTKLMQAMSTVSHEAKTASLSVNRVASVAMTIKNMPPLRTPESTARPASTELHRAAIAELAKLSRTRVNLTTVQFNSLCVRIAGHQETCTNAMADATAKLVARTKEFNAIAIKMRVAATVHSQVRCDREAMSVVRQSLLTANTPRLMQFAADYKAVEAALLAKDQEGRELLLALNASLPKDIPALWDASCAAQTAFFDAEFMSRELTAAFDSAADSKSASATTEWSSTALSAKFATAATAHHEAMLREINGPLPDVSLDAGIKTVRSISAPFMANWALYWTQDAPTALAISASAVVQGEATLKLTRFAMESYDANTAERCRGWLSESGALDTSPMRFMNVPLSDGTNPLIGDVMSQMSPPFMRSELTTAELVRNTLVTFACGKLEDSNKKKKIGQKIALMD